MPRFWNWLRNALRAGRNSSSRRATPSKRKSVSLSVEALEARELLSISINWSNEGYVANRGNSDNFDKFGTNAAQARNVVHTAIQEWQSVINNFNRRDHSTTLDVTVSVDTTNQTPPGGLNTNITKYDVDGKPLAATILINQFAAAGGVNWSFDPNLWSSKFLGTPTQGKFGSPAQTTDFVENAYAGYAPAGSTAAGQSDLLDPLTHEFGHALGFLATPQVNARCTDTGELDNSSGDGNTHGKGDFWLFQGPTGFTALLTAFNSGTNGGSDAGGGEHFAPADASWTNPKTGVTYYGSDDLLTPYYASGQRRIVSQSDADVLRDAYGYSVNDPAQALGTFYAVRDETGTLTVRGRQDAPSNDTISLSTANGTTVVTSVTLGTPVPGLPPDLYVAQFPAGPINKINLLTGAGTSTVNINAAFTAPITVTNGGPANVFVGGGNASLVAAPVSILNQSAARTNIAVNDTLGTGNQTWAFQQAGGGFATITRQVGPAITYRSADAGEVSLSTGKATENVNVYGVRANSLTLNGNSDSTFVTLGNGNLQYIQAAVQVANLYHTALTVDDSNDSGGISLTLDNSPAHSGYGRISGLLQPIDFKYDSISPSAGVTLRSGKLDSWVNVNTAVVPLQLVANSTATRYTVGGPSGLDGIATTVAVTGTPGILPTLNVDDRGHGGLIPTFTAAYSVSPSYLSTRSARIFFPTPDAGAAPSSTGQLNFYASNSGINFITVFGSSDAWPVAVNGGLGANFITISANNPIADSWSLGSPVTVIGGGYTSLALDDTATRTAQSYTITGSTVGRTDLPVIGYRNVQNLEVDGGNSHNQFNIQGTAAGVVTTVNGGTGGDWFTVQGVDYTMDAIQGQLTIHGRPVGSPSNYERVFLYDYFNGAAQTFDFTATTATRSGLAPITFDRFTEVDVYLSGYAAATINVQGVAAGTLLNLVVEDGDTVIIGDGSGTLTSIAGYVFVNTVAGSQTVVVDDSADTSTPNTTSVTYGGVVYLEGLTQGWLAFDNPTSVPEVLQGPGGIAGLDAFFALLAEQPAF